ncbi:energy transducer TonB [Sphingomonas sp. RP10(2022)]|uniref:Energy transducer TonB n=1 Tax=Sphingomonas liriopis TaxID=2949094 RepID=A0A9X2HV49_9SPHN|nr:energy transducer TonB [Sphingomonas liriopis]MCP3734118.1 energy transducer TonB [Sphingomonas liriopis]
MMYADRYPQPTRFNPGGLTAAVAINAALVAALMFAGPKILPGSPEHTLITENIPLDPPPPPTPPEAKPAEPTPNRPTETIFAPIPPIPVPSHVDVATTTTVTPPIAGPMLGTDTGPVVEASPAPPPPLPLVGPSVDPRYADDFQPIYPPSERRANRDGRVTVRVLVGTDGRVKQIERVTATSDAFWQATQERALKAWRFRAATRGSVPVEAWRTMTLTFRMED